MIILSVVIAAAVISGIVLNAYSSAVSASPVGEGTVQGLLAWNGLGLEGLNNGNFTADMFPSARGGMRGHGCGGFLIEVSEEFKENVISIAENDSDVQSLLNEGYNITQVKPMIKMVVEGDGSVTTKATSAVLTLEKDTTGRATVWVDLEQGKVTKIAIMTLTVIDKS
ncbi:MAG: hypothetical protein QXJ94_02170 [Candidatus Bathyarchaeia archaeon]